MSREEAEVLVLREVDTATLRWPDDTDLDDYGSSSNRLYRDMRAFSWDDAANALDLEETLLSAHGWDLGAAQEGLGRRRPILDAMGPGHRSGLNRARVVGSGLCADEQLQRRIWAHAAVSRGEVLLPTFARTGPLGCRLRSWLWLSR